MGKKAATGSKKKVPAAPLGKPTETKVKKNYLFEKRARNFRIGGDIQPSRDVTRFTRWPLYIRHQRQKRILLARIKVPPTLAQFSRTAPKDQFASMARLFKKYKPETRAQKKLRLREQAEAQAEGKAVNQAAPFTIKYGLNHIVNLVEDKKAKLVVIAHDVDPIELVCFLPTLCRKKDIPYMIVKGKSRLGKLVNKKTAAAVALTNVRKEDAKDLEALCDAAHASFNDNVEMRRTWGGGIRGVKSEHIRRRREALLEQELAKKTGLIVA